MTPSELQHKTVKDLRRIAGEYDLPNRTRLTKTELIQAIAAALARSGDAPTVLAAPTASAAPLLGSSTAASTPASSTPPQAVPAKPVEPPPTTDPGLPIPDRYGQDRLVLLVQDPSHLFAYWELADGTLQRVLEAAADGERTPVLVIHGTNGSEQREVDLGGGNYYVSVSSGSRFNADLALRDRNGGLTVIVSSNPVQTPPSGPSEHTDEQWMAVDSSFHELLTQAGLPGQTGASAELVAKERLRSRLWAETGVRPVSSASLAGQPQPAPPGLSSHVLGSHNLGSHTLAKRS